MRPSMMRSASQLLLRRLRRSYSSASGQPERKVAILGAAGGIGQPLALLVKLNPLVSSLSLYDIAGTPGVAADVSHINSPALVPPSLRFALRLDSVRFVFLVLTAPGFGVSRR
jgi:malate dehydrogenase